MLVTMRRYVFTTPPLQELEKPARVGIIARSELEELQRLVPNVDLVSYDVDVPSYNGAKREDREVVFKSYFHEHDLHERWDKLNLWMRLPPHPNIVPLIDLKWKICTANSL